MIKFYRVKEWFSLSLGSSSRRCFISFTLCSSIRRKAYTNKNKAKCEINPTINSKTKHNLSMYLLTTVKGSSSLHKFSIAISIERVGRCSMTWSTNEEVHTTVSLRGVEASIILFLMFIVSKKNSVQGRDWCRLRNNHHTRNYWLLDNNDIMPFRGSNVAASLLAWAFAPFLWFWKAWGLGFWKIGELHYFKIKKTL